MKIKTDTKTIYKGTLSKEWGKIITEKSKKPLKITYKKNTDKDWMFKALGWKKK